MLAVSTIRMQYAGGARHTDHVNLMQEQTEQAGAR